MKSFVRIALIAVCVSLVAAAPAAADAPASRTTTSTVSGATVVSEVLRGLSSVQIGSEGLTMTVLTDGGAREVSVEYGGLVKDAGGDADKGILPWAAFGTAAFVFLSFLRFLVMLGR